MDFRDLVKEMDVKANNKLAHRTFRDGHSTVVIDACLLSFGAEWWHIAENWPEYAG